MKFSTPWLYWLPSLLCSYLWVLAISVLADVLSRFGLTVFTAGLLVVLPALLMPFYRGLFCVVLSGFLVDAATPIPFELTGALSFFTGERNISLFGDMPNVIPASFGFITGWMIFAYLILRLVRPRLDLAVPSKWIICAMLVNSIILVFWGLALGWNQITNPDYCVNFAASFILSSGTLFALGWWYFDLVLCGYRICGINLVAERDVECA